MDAILGVSPPMQALRTTLARLGELQNASAQQPTVLIEGETGTGKGLVASTLHRTGRRARGPFVAVNCAAIPEGLLEAELFGYERGAFTDARTAKSGLLQTAHQGTIFLDEIGLLPESLQGKLLTVLEDRAVRRLGGTRAEPIDVRVIAATSSDLEEAMRSGRFLDALFHRLAVMRLQLPPLRQRGDDVLLLADHFLARSLAAYGLPSKSFAADARAALRNHRWPGNIRELGNIVERVALLSDEPLITAEALALPAPVAGRTPAPRGAAAEDEADDEVDEARMLKVLEETGWNISRAAARLGIPRTTLRYRASKARAQKVTPPPALTPTPTEADPVPLAWEGRRAHLVAVKLGGDGAAVLASSAAGLLELVLDKIEIFGGRVEEHAADGVVASFGVAPLEDAVRRAINAARACQNAATHAEGAGALRIGIHSSQLAVAQAGDVAVIEAQVRRAAWASLDELLAAAPPGVVVVSEAAATLTRHRFDLATTATPGVLRLEGAKQLVDPGGPRFVGRELEVELLRGRLRGAVGGRGHLVGVMGEAGIGKSRVLAEVRRQLAPGTAVYLEGRCLSHGHGVPYLPIIDLVRGLLGLSDEDDEAFRDKARRRLALAGLDADEAAPYILRLCGRKTDDARLALLSSEAIQARTFAVLRQLFVHAAADQPLLIAIEDLHWIDAASDHFLAALADDIAAAPILLVGTYRPGAHPRWLARAHATQIALPPLGRDESRALALDVLAEKQLPATVLDELLVKADGNRFFLEEIARALRERAAGGSALGVPENVEEVIRERLERLPPLPQRLLRMAAVLGREFPLRLLQAVWQGRESLEPVLVELKRVDLLRELPRAREPTCAFKHALIQEVAYASVAPAARQALHAAAGRALENLYPTRLEELYELCAHHYARSAETTKAVDYLALANRKAARANAAQTAKSYFEAAMAQLAALPQTPANQRRRIALLIDQQTVFILLLEMRAYHDLLRAAEPIAGALGDPGLLGLLRARLGTCQWTFGRFDESLATLAPAIELCDRGAPQETSHHVTILWDHVSKGNLDEALALERPVLARVEQWFHPLWNAYALAGVAWAKLARGRFADALDSAKAALAIGERVGDPSLISFGAWNMARVHDEEGDAVRAEDLAHLAAAKALTPGDHAWAQATLAGIWCRSDSPRRGIDLLAESVALGRATGFANIEFWVPRLGEGQARLGEMQAARETFTGLLETATRHDMQLLVGVAYRWLAQLTRAADPTLARSHAASAVAILERIGAAPELDHARRLAAEL